MSETKHTPGPWRNDPAKGSAVGAAPVIVADTCWRGTTREIAKVLFHGGSEDPEVQANARRIVACVNACEGINPKAVPDLLAACKEVLRKNNGYSVTEQLRTAIAKAEAKP